MKRLLLITLLCVGFAWGSENNASSYPKHWTAEDIEWHKSLGDDGTSIEDAIYICNNGGHKWLSQHSSLSSFKGT